MNLNFHSKPDYGLHTRMIDEMINLYGTPVRFLSMTKIVDSYGASNSHEDVSGFPKIFGDFKTLKTDLYRDALEFHILISDSEEYPNGLQFAFNNFGLINDDTLTAFVSLKSLQPLSDANGNVHPKEIISNVLVFPNGKLMEITDCQLHVPGINNKFVYSNAPSCYQLSLKSYSFDRSAVELKTKNDARIQVDEGVGNFGAQTVSNVDAFFGVQDELAAEIAEAAENEQVVADECDILEDKIIKQNIDDVFGSYA